MSKFFNHNVIRVSELTREGLSPHEHGHQITLPTILPREWRKYIDELSDIAYWRTEKLNTVYKLNVKK
jgi:hypothetical protein